MLSLFLQKHETYPKITRGKRWREKEVGRSVLGLNKRMIFPSVTNPAFSFLRKDCALPSQVVFFKAPS